MNNEYFDPDRFLSKHNERLERVGGIMLNLDYWDCECERNFIHPIALEECKVCGGAQEESPSSHQPEVLRFVHGESA